jgi:hypothetical protein
MQTKHIPKDLAEAKSRGAVHTETGLVCPFEILPAHKLVSIDSFGKQGMCNGTCQATKYVAVQSHTTWDMIFFAAPLR